MKNGSRAIDLSKQQLRKLQLEMLDILIEFDRICKKHEITYFLSGGTLLGAVRHQGFIPWDDDVDVEMPRSAYERFCAVCEQELDTARFFWQTQQNDAFYFWSYGKLRLKNTVYVRSGQEHLRQRTGICIDVFPLDLMNENLFLQRSSEILCRFCRKLFWAQVGCKTEELLWKRILYKFLASFPRKWGVALFESAATVCKNKDTDFFVFNCMDSRSDRGYLLRRSWFASSVAVVFEGRVFPAPVGYQEILCFWYGDYMKLPPPEEQVAHSMASYIRFSDHTELKAEVVTQKELGNGC